MQIEIKANIEVKYMDDDELKDNICAIIADLFALGEDSGIIIELNEVSYKSKQALCEVPVKDMDCFQLVKTYRQHVLDFCKRNNIYTAELITGSSRSKNLLAQLKSEILGLELHA